MTDPERPSPDAARRGGQFTNPWWLLSALLVGIVVGLLVWLLATPGAPDRDTAAPAVEDTEGTVTEPDSGSACGLPGGDQTLPVTTPDPPDPDITGPGDSTDGVPVCYAPTPVGAVHAAANFITAVASPTTRVAAATHLTAPGPGRDEALDELGCGDDNKATVCPGGPDNGVRMVAFDVTAYQPAAATIDVAVTTGQGGWAHFPLTLVWSGGDWKVQLPADGSPFADARPLPTLAGYVRL